MHPEVQETIHEAENQIQKLVSLVAMMVKSDEPNDYVPKIAEALENLDASLLALQSLLDGQMASQLSPSDRKKIHAAIRKLIIAMGKITLTSIEKLCRQIEENAQPTAGMTR